MKIDEIIKKSIEIPGISIKRGEFSAELILKERDGKGSMTFFPLFPGVTLAYIFVNSPAWTAPDFHDNGSMETGPLLLNYCVTGRCELILNRFGGDKRIAVWRIVRLRISPHLSHTQSFRYSG